MAWVFNDSNGPHLNRCNPCAEPRASRTISLATDYAPICSQNKRRAKIHATIQFIRFSSGQVPLPTRSVAWVFNDSNGPHLNRCNPCAEPRASRTISLATDYAPICSQNKRRAKIHATIQFIRFSSGQVPLPTRSVAWVFNDSNGPHLFTEQRRAKILTHLFPAPPPLDTRQVFAVHLRQWRLHFLVRNPHRQIRCLNSQPRAKGHRQC